MRLRFNLPYRDYDERTCVIVVDVAGKIAGLVVDRVQEVVEIAAEQIEPSPCHNGAQNYIQGIGKIENEVKILLDIETLVAEMDMQN